MEKYADFYKLKDLSQESLMHLFVQRLLSRFDSPLADDIILEESDRPSTYEERERIKQEKEAFYYRHSNEVSEKEFAAREIRRLNPLDVDDIYLSARIEAYLKLCSTFVEKLTQPEVALLCYYKSEPITEGNKEEKGAKYDVGKGSKLAESYGDFKSPLNRMPSGHKDAETQLKRFERIIPLLKGEGKDKAEQEYNNLKDKYLQQ